MLRKEDGWIHWEEPAVLIERKVRAYQPWPTAMTCWNKKVLKILKARVHTPVSSTDEPGTVIPWEQRAAVVTGEGILELLEVQLAGKRPMEVEAFLRGARGFIGSRLGCDKK